MFSAIIIQYLQDGFWRGRKEDDEVVSPAGAATSKLIGRLHR